MDEPGKYLIRATVTANGVVERSDVVGAVFGQTEGLLGDEIDLRTLQEQDRVGRIEVDIESAGGRSTGTITIATDMERTETAVLAAGLECIERVGPARARVHVDRIEDVRAAKRRRIVDRAKELLDDGFEDVGLGGADLVEAVREATEPAEITQFAGLPAGPDVKAAEELVVVEGRADVLRLLEAGVTNVIGVEGTDVPDAVAKLSSTRKTTAFFDGDRGGDLLLLELAQVGDVDFVTFAPPGRAVEDLSLAEVHDALARKVPYDGDVSGAVDVPEDGREDRSLTATVAAELEAAFDGGAGGIHILDDAWTQLATGQDATALEATLREAGSDAHIALVDATADQSMIDVADRFGIGLVIAHELGSFVKRPTSVRVFQAAEILEGRRQPEDVSA